MESYVYAAAYAKSLESRLISENDLRTLETLSHGDMKKMLADAGYRGESVPKMLENSENELWEMCMQLCEKEMSRLAVLNDLHNIKTVFKSTLSSCSWENLIKKPTAIDCARLAEAFKSGEFSMLENYRELCEEMNRIYKEKGTCFAEALADKNVLLEMLSDDDGYVKEFAQITALCADLRICLRCSALKKDFLKDALIPCDLIDTDRLINGMDKEEELKNMGFAKAYECYETSPYEFEKYCERLVHEFSENAEKDYFGFGSVLAYFLRKKEEFKNIRHAYYMDRKEVSA